MPCFDVVNEVPYDAPWCSDEQAAQAPEELASPTPDDLMSPMPDEDMDYGDPADPMAAAAPFMGMYDGPTVGPVCKLRGSDDEARLYAQEKQAAYDDCVSYSRTAAQVRCEGGTLPLGMRKPDDMSVDECVDEWAAGDTGGSTSNQAGSSVTNTNGVENQQQLEVSAPIKLLGVKAGVTHKTTDTRAVMNNSGRTDTTNKRAYVGFEQRCEEEADAEIQDPNRR
jgi:hypothetical protein